jgi:putative membrane-bound dehydrogenase-like protein
MNEVIQMRTILASVIAIVTVKSGWITNAFVAGKDMLRIVLTAIILTCSFVSITCADIEPAADAPQPMTPQESAAKIRLPKGFRIELVASEPLVQDPSCITFDERGRLFVCELHGYNIEGHLDVTELNRTGVLDNEVRRIRWELEGGRIAKAAAMLQHGVVKLLTDTNDDGVMDEAIVWANDLPPCYGVVPARGGVIVVCAPDIIYLADRDGDGKPEIRETLFTGFGTRVLERGINNPHWGLDNWIYVGAGGDGGTIRGPHLAKPVELQHSDFRIRADGSEIEPVTGRVGTFGLTMNDVGDRFPSTGGRPAMYALPLPWHYLTRNPHVPTPETNHYAATYNRGFRISQPHPWRVRRRQDPAWVKFYGERETDSNFFSGGCSNTFYGDTLFPEQYRGNIFYCEPSLNMVHRCVVTRDGAGYKGQRAASEQQSEFLASTDQWFRPMNLRVGPDGALYIVDMYREIIEDYSAIPRFLQQQYGLDQGGDHGRIWRLVPESGARMRFDDFAGFSTEQLVQATGDAGFWRRITAQRLLIEHDDASAADMLAAHLRAGVTAQAIIHALYTLDGLGRLQASDVARALEHPHYGARIHALRLSDHWLDMDDALSAKVLSMTGDADPAVRLQLAMTLGELDDARVVETLLKLAREHGSERWMAAAILSSSSSRAGDVLAGLLRQVEHTQGARALLEPLATTVAGRRDGSAMSLVLATIPGLDEAAAGACLAGLVEGISHGNKALPAAADGWAGVSRLLGSDSPLIRDLATKLAAKLPLADKDQLKRIFAGAVQRALSASSSLVERRRAMQILVSAPYDTLHPAAISLLDARQAPTLQYTAMESLGASGDPRVGRALLNNWERYTPQVRHAALQAVFARTNRLPALLDAVESQRVLPTDINALQREQLLAAGDKRIADRAQQLFASTTTSAELQQRIGRYQHALSATRDVERGKLVFAKHCLACHKLKDEGHEVGPALGSITNRPDETILLDLLDPSGRIEPEYRSFIVTTEDGRTFTGIMVSESPTSVTLLKEKGTRESILRKDIDVIKASEVSLMPSNLHEHVSPQSAADLISFLRHELNRQIRK